METFWMLGHCINFTYKTKDAWIRERQRMAKGDTTNCCAST